MFVIRSLFVGSEIFVHRIINRNLWLYVYCYIIYILMLYERHDKILLVYHNKTPVALRNVGAML